ncbi:MAG: transglycosylase domain-containing protein [Nitriliruptorales bacterium]|nr:transglycosylase domain-containing protein [Nitriliruptorales bacterium]
MAVVASACSRVVTLEAPEIDAVPRIPPEQSIVYDADGNQLAVLRKEFRERVPLKEVPSHLIDAVIAAEDKRFLQHAGVDARAIARAAIANQAAGEVVQGGSTITQQLVKNLYMPAAPRTPETKFKEALLAHQLEEEHDKNWILEEYLNTVYFGNGAYGIQAAAETYWRKDARELDLADAALLAGMLRAPESLNPARFPDRARDRRAEVLEAMAAEGLITPLEAERAQQRRVDVAPRPPIPATVEPHWVDFVIRTLQEDPSFGATREERSDRIYGGGLRIHTTLRPTLQEAAREVISEHLSDGSDPEAAIVTIDPDTGHVLAAAHAVPYDELQFDLATQARRQPGSTFKAVVLAAALGSGYTPDSPTNGTQARLTKPDGVTWNVRNASGVSYGRITLAEATRASVNAAYARLILDLGVPRVAALARAMGVESPVPDDAQIAIGGGSLAVTPVDMAAVFATLANLGEHVPATPVSRIENAGGDVVWRPDEIPRPAVRPADAFVATEMLQAVVERGTGRRAQIPGWEVAGKTGTTNDYTDAWFVGYTATMATSVWVGHPQGRIPMRWVHGFPRVLGGTIPADIWRDYMLRALEGQDPVEFTLPAEHYEVVEIDPETGLRAAPWCPGEPTPLPRTLVPEDTCPSPVPGEETPLEPSPEETRTSTAVPASPSAEPSPPPTTPSPSSSPTEEPSGGSESPSEPAPSESPTASEADGA